MKDVVIIGGGAAGLTAAIVAARKNKKVTILEKNEKCGKKILLTGNGRCNYWNEDMSISHYHSSNEEHIKEIINEENTKKVLSFFESLGIIPKIKNGYFYPVTEQGLTIYNALLYEAKKLNVEIINNIDVIEIIKNDSFIINQNKGKNIKAKKIILCPGSKAAPKTGSNGSGYVLASTLNHHIIEPKPALVQLIGEEDYFNKWNGIRIDAKLSLYEDGKYIKEETGQLQLTDYGISGIVTFNLSRYVARNISKHEEIISINFLPWLKENPHKWLKKMSQLNSKINETLEKFLNYKLINIILKKSGIKKNDWQKLSDKEFSTLVNTITNFKLKITGTKSFENAQVCSGGVPLSEINLNTMESYKTKDLYLAGEILDIDGDCGGYNLGFAWISGIIAGENVWLELGK